MSRLTRDGTVEPVSRDHEQDWQPYPVDPYSAICDEHVRVQNIDYTEPGKSHSSGFSMGFLSRYSLL